MREWGCVSCVAESKPNQIKQEQIVLFYNNLLFQKSYLKIQYKFENINEICVIEKLTSYFPLVRTADAAFGDLHNLVCSPVIIINKNIILF